MSGRGNDIHVENSVASCDIEPVIEQCTRLLSAAFPDAAREEALTLISHILSIPNVKLRLEANSLKIPDSLKDEIMDKTLLRSKHMPVQYIMGKTFFYDDEFVVGEGVLIPRSDTEILVEESISIVMDKICNFNSNLLSDNIAPDNCKKSVHFLEFCTGSGCISISLAKAVAAKGVESFGVATDISDAALVYARKNLQKIMPLNNISIIKHDLFSDSRISVFTKAAGFDMIISNPPYIKSEVLAELQPEITEFEPMLALDGGVDGMKFYRRILDLSVKLLNPGGYVLFEIGFDQSEQIRELFENFGFFDNIYIKEDYSGNPRIAVARKSSLDEVNV